MYSPVYGSIVKTGRNACILVVSSSSGSSLKQASVAQLVEHSTDTRAVVGSNPTACTRRKPAEMAGFLLLYFEAMILQVGVKVLLKREDGKLLLVRRNEETYGKMIGKWDIPGGRIEPGSSLMENLRREVQEETSLAVTSDPRLIGAQDIS